MRRNAAIDRTWYCDKCKILFMRRRLPNHCPLCKSSRITLRATAEQQRPESPAESTLIHSLRYALDPDDAAPRMPGARQMVPACPNCKQSQSAAIHLAKLVEGVKAMRTAQKLLARLNNPPNRQREVLTQHAAEKIRAVEAHIARIEEITVIPQSLDTLTPSDKGA